jgi:hypothetical protein
MCIIWMNGLACVMHCTGVYHGVGSYGIDQLCYFSQQINIKFLKGGFLVECDVSLEPRLYSSGE